MIHTNSMENRSSQVSELPSGKLAKNVDFSGPTHKILFTRSSEGLGNLHFVKLHLRPKLTLKQVILRSVWRTLKSSATTFLSWGTSGGRKGSESTECRGWWSFTPKTNQPGEKPLPQFTDPIFKSGDGGWEWVQEKSKGTCPGPWVILNAGDTDSWLRCQVKAVIGCGAYCCTSTRKYTENCPKDDITAGTPPAKLSVLLIPRLYVERHHRPKLNSHLRHFTFWRWYWRPGCTQENLLAALSSEW